MTYQVSRNGQIYGPYTLEDVQRYVASGNILPTDMAKSDEMPDWVPVSQLLAAAAPPPAAPGGFASPGYANPAAAQPAYAPVGVFPAAAPNTANLATSPYPDAPNLHWGLVLLFALLTCSVFMWVWNIIVAAWLKRVQPNATSILYYIGAAVLLFVQVAVTVPNAMHQLQPGLHTGYNPVGSLVGLLVWVVRLIARFSQRSSLQEHFNTVEPIGLDLNPVMTFFFGGLYFQAELNRINAMKQAARMGAPRAY